MKDLPKTLCIAPWVHLYSDPNGDLRSCCTVNSDPGFGNTRDYTSIKDAANSPKMKELRQAFLRGEKPDVCKVCWVHEGTSASGNNSYRKYLNRVYLDQSRDLVEQTLPDGSLENFKLKYYDFRWSNTCNFACISCSPIYSSKWAIELGRPDQVFHLPNKQHLIDELINHRLDEIRMLYLVGGEPFLIPEHWRLLEALCANGNAENITIQINSNLSLLQFEKKNALDYLPKFKNVEIIASLDHIGDKAELIRYGTNWQEIVKNLSYIRDLNQPNIQVITNTVITSLNILDLPDILRKFHEMYREKLLMPETLYRAMEPNWLDSRNLPRSVLEKVAAELREVQQEAPADNDKLFHYKNVIIPDVADFILTDSPHDAQAMKHRFIEHMDELDRKRKTHWRQTLPELAEVIGRL